MLRNFRNTIATLWSRAASQRRQQTTSEIQHDGTAQKVRNATEIFGEEPLVIVAHPDDEVIATGILLQQCPHAWLLVATSGESAYGAGSQSARASLAARRERELVAAHALVPNVEMLDFKRVPDKQVYLSLEDAATKLFAALGNRKPTTLLTHAFEGGHPDHDSLSFLASRISRIWGIPVWEFPEYTTFPQPRIQQFPLEDIEPIVELCATPRQLHRKRKMFACHRSQRDVLRSFSSSHPECFRRQSSHPYFAPLWKTYPGYPEQIIREMVGCFERFDQTSRPGAFGPALCNVSPYDKRSCL